MAIRGVSLLDMDFSKELVRRSVLWLHQVECDVHQQSGHGEALPRRVQAVPTGQESTRLQN